MCLQLLTRLAVSYVLTIYLPGPATLRVLDAALWRDNLVGLLQSNGRALILLDLLAANYNWLSFHFPSNPFQVTQLNILLADGAGFIPDLALEAVAVLKRLGGADFFNAIFPLAIDSDLRDSEVTLDRIRQMLISGIFHPNGPTGLNATRGTLVLLAQGLYNLITSPLLRNDLGNASHLPPLTPHSRLLAALLRLDPILAPLLLTVPQCDMIR